MRSIQFEPTDEELEGLFNALIVTPSLCDEHRACYLIVHNRLSDKDLKELTALEGIESIGSDTLKDNGSDMFTRWFFSNRYRGYLLKVHDRSSLKQAVNIALEADLITVFSLSIDSEHRLVENELSNIEQFIEEEPSCFSLLTYTRNFDNPSGLLVKVSIGENCPSDLQRISNILAS